jgi:hypothetical protein
VAIVAIVYIVNVGRLRPGVDHILMLLAGFLTMAAMTFAFWSLSEATTSKVAGLELSEPIAREVLARLGTDLKITRRATQSESSPWELTVGQLVGMDNALAMAKLRMDIERELRRIADAVGIEIKGRRIMLSELGRELEIRQTVPIEISMLIRDLLSVSNQAVHGARITDEQARSTAALGDELIDFLRRLPRAEDPPVAERPRGRMIDLDE